MHPAGPEGVTSHVAAGRLDEAAQALVLCLQSAWPTYADEAVVIRSELTRLRDAERRSEWSAAEVQQARRRLAHQILELCRVVKERDAGPAPAAPLAAPPAAVSDHRLDRRANGAISSAAAAGTAAPSAVVFVSYNHADAAIAQALCAALKEAGLGVLVDAQAMQPGQDIAHFIRESINASQTTVCLLSQASLLSGWVAQETLRALAAPHWGVARRFIGLYLDADFLAPQSRLALTQRIDERLAQAQALRQKHEALHLDTLDLDADLVRLNALRAGLGEILRHLRHSLCLDWSEPQRAPSLARLIASLREPTAGQGRQAMSAAP
jgi:hypothetical protein